VVPVENPAIFAGSKDNSVFLLDKTGSLEWKIDDAIILSARRTFVMQIFVQFALSLTSTATISLICLQLQVRGTPAQEIAGLWPLP
jgi:hypothetical protein